MIRLENISLERNGRAVLSDLNLTLGIGVHVILGPNGSGKSTLLRLLATVSELKVEGQAHVLGVDIAGKQSRRSVRDRLGFAPQEIVCPPAFTIRQLVEYVGFLKGIESQNIDRQALLALATTGLEPLQNRQVARLSGGERQRANLAQAIVNEPDIVLLDEPTAGLDFRTARSLRDDLYELGRSKCVVLTTHLAADVLDSVASVSIISDGHMKAFGSYSDFTAAEADYGY